MSSESLSTRRAPASRWTVLAPLAVAVALTAACGHKKPPIAPPSKIPQRVTVTAHQRGHEAIVGFVYPTTTISGTALPGISKVEIWRLAQEVPDFALELLAEEEARREEAQELLDELGLELYETAPVPDAVTGPDGAADAAAGAVPTAVPSDEEELGEPEETAPADEAQEPAADEAQEPPADEAQEPPADEAQGPPAADVVQGATAAGQERDAEEDEADATGDDSEAEGDEAASEEVELSEEELLAQRVEAARNLLRTPPTSKDSFIRATAKDFRKDAEVVLTVGGDAILDSLVGDRVLLRLPLPPAPEEGPELGYIYGARVFSLNGKPSDLSNHAAILPGETPPAPQAIAVEARADGVWIEWSAEEDPKEGFRIYRRDASARVYGDPVATVVATERSFTDRQAVFGARYIYGVTSVGSTTPLVESEISSEHEIDYEDRFGPATPSDLVVFPEAGRVRLLWTTVADPDLAGYEVLRRRSVDEEPVVVTEEPVAGGQYLDDGVPPGTWLYSVRAVDLSGNRSESSAEREARVP